MFRQKWAEYRLCTRKLTQTISLEKKYSDMAGPDQNTHLHSLIKAAFPVCLHNSLVYQNIMVNTLIRLYRCKS